MTVSEQEYQSMWKEIAGVTFTPVANLIVSEVDGEQVFTYEIIKTADEVCQDNLNQSSIETIKQVKIDEISLACKNVIYGGFASSAYQSIEKTYGTSAEDQLNITGNALSATSKIAGVVECQDDKFYYHAIGEDFAEWTAKECLQLAKDFKGFKESALLKSKMLQSYVSVLVTAEDVNAITWETEIPTT